MRKSLTLLLALIVAVASSDSAKVADPLLGSGGRILGGSDAALGQFRHMASLRIWYINGWYHNCGGSLITERWVLTAAHCLTDYTSDQIKVYVGTVTTNNDDGEVFDCELLIPHPDFGTTPIRDDVGLIKLNKEVTISATVRPIRLNPKHQLPTIGQELIVSGLGRMENGQSADRLQFLRQTVWDLPRCNRSLVSANLNEQNLCAFNGDGRGACNGDSGSPLVNVDGSLQFGIASWVRQPCASNHPDVYVRVSDYLSWISLQVYNNS